MDKVLFIDTNIGLDHALGIAKKYEVWFAVVHSRAFPRLEDEINGYGFEEIRKVWDWAEGLDNGCNVVVFADSGFGYLAEYLRKDGYAVFGSDAKTELMELDRVYFKKVCRGYGIPTPSYDIARGIDEVRRIIEEKGKRFIKISRFRGSVETFATDSPEEAEEKLRGSELAMFANDLEFVLEEPMDKNNMVEVGVDAFFNGREFLDVVFNTIELRWCGNFTQASRLEESIWYDVLKKIEPFLVKNGYRGMIAFEGFFDGETVYVTDPTPRYPYVCSYAYPRMIRNYADVVVGVAKGEDVDIDLVSEFSVQIPVYTDKDKEWREIESKNWEMTALRHSVKVGDRIMWIPVEDNVIATAIGLGGNIKEAIANAIDVVEGIKALESYHRAYEFKQYFIETWRRLKEINDGGLKKGKITVEIGGEVSKQQESDVPPEHRLYIRPEDLSKLPKEIKVYRGPKGGLYVDRRELRRLTGREEVEEIPEKIFSIENLDKIVRPVELEGVGCLKKIDFDEVWSGKHKNVFEISGEYYAVVDCKELAGEINEVLRKLKDDIRLWVETYKRDIDTIVKYTSEAGRSRDEIRKIVESRLAFGSSEFSKYIAAVEVARYVKEKYGIDIDIPKPKIKQITDFLKKYGDKIMLDDKLVDEFLYSAIKNIAEGGLDGREFINVLISKISNDKILRKMEEYVKKEDIDLNKVRFLYYGVKLRVDEKIEFEGDRGAKFNLWKISTENAYVLHNEKFEEIIRGALRKIYGEKVRVIEESGGDVLDLVKIDDIYKYLERIKRGYKWEDKIFVERKFEYVHKPEVNVELPEVFVGFDDEIDKFVVKIDGKVVYKADDEELGKATDSVCGYVIGDLLTAWKYDSGINPAAVLERAVANALGDKPKLLREYDESKVGEYAEEEYFDEEESEYEFVGPYHEGRVKRAYSVSVGDVNRESVKKMVAMAQTLIEKDEIDLYRGVSEAEEKQLIDFIMSDKDEEMLETYYLTAFSDSEGIAEKFNRNIAIGVRVHKDAVVFIEQMAPGSAYAEGEVVIRNPEGMKIKKNNVLISNYDVYDNKFVEYDEERFPFSSAMFLWIVGRKYPEYRDKVVDKLEKFIPKIRERVRLNKEFGFDKAVREFEWLLEDYEKWRRGE